MQSEDEEGAQHLREDTEDADLVRQTELLNTGTVVCAFRLLRHN